VDAQLGLERDPETYVKRMVAVFRDVKRVLRRDGTLWLNLGSSYAGSWGNYHPDSPPGKHGQRLKETARWNRPAYESQEFLPPTATVPGFKPKDLIPIPWMVAMALQRDGWWLRSDIIWAKPNPMPESCTDRPTKAHEYLFLLSKSASYFYDAEATREKELSLSTIERYGISGEKAKRTASTIGGNSLEVGMQSQFTDSHCNPAGRNKRTVWTVATAPYPEAHFATYPPDLIKPCILAGTSARGCCPKCGAPWERITESEKTFQSGSGRAGNMPIGKQDLRASETNSTPDIRLGPVVSTKTTGWQPTCGCDVSHENDDQDKPLTATTDPCTVLDPFAGSGTTGAVALELGRKAVLIELNPAYVKLCEERCNVTPGLALA
jgi:DNA modification methylase